MTLTDDELVARSDRRRRRELQSAHPAMGTADLCLGVSRHRPRRGCARRVSGDVPPRVPRAARVQGPGEVFVVAVSHRAEPVPRLDPPAATRAGRCRCRRASTRASSRRSAVRSSRSRSWSAAVELSAVVEEAMALLPEEQRTAIILKEYHGMTFQEIADMQGCPLSTVKTRLYQGLTVLRRHLEKNGVRQGRGVLEQVRANDTATGETMMSRDLYLRRSRRARVVSLRRMRRPNERRDDRRAPGGVRRVRGGTDRARRHTRAARDVDAAGCAARFPNRAPATLRTSNVSASSALVAAADARMGAGGCRRR